MNKQGAELAFNTIIIAVIAVLVLLVAVYFIYQAVINTDEGTACVNEGGRCVDECDTTILTDTDTGRDLCERGVCCSVVPAG